MVVALIALASGLVGLSLRDPAAAQLDREGVRLAALLEGARAESRVLGVPVRFVLATEGNTEGDFRFMGLPADDSRPQRWLDEAVQASIVGAPALQLGPEPLIGAQRIVLRLGERRLTLATDGLAPFAPLDEAGPAP